MTALSPWGWALLAAPAAYAVMVLLLRRRRTLSVATGFLWARVARSAGADSLRQHRVPFEPHQRWTLAALVVAAMAAPWWAAGSAQDAAPPAAPPGVRARVAVDPASGAVEWIFDRLPDPRGLNAAGRPAIALGESTAVVTHARGALPAAGPVTLASDAGVVWRGEWRPPVALRVAGECPAAILRVAAMLGRPVTSAAPAGADVRIGADGGRIAVTIAPLGSSHGPWRATASGEALFGEIPWESMAGTRATPAARLDPSLEPLVVDAVGTVIGRERATGRIVIGASIDEWSRSVTFPMAWRVLLGGIPGASGALDAAAAPAAQAADAGLPVPLSPWFALLALGLGGVAVLLVRQTPVP